MNVTSKIVGGWITQPRSGSASPRGLLSSCELTIGSFFVLWGPLPNRDAEDSEHSPGPPGVEASHVGPWWPLPPPRGSSGPLTAGLSRLECAGVLGIRDCLGMSEATIRSRSFYPLSLEQRVEKPDQEGRKERKGKAGGGEETPSPTAQSLPSPSVSPVWEPLHKPMVRGTPSEHCYLTPTEGCGRQAVQVRKPHR